MANGIWPRERGGRKEVWIVYKDHLGKRHRDKIGLDTPDVRRLAQDVLTRRRNEALTNKFFPERMVLDTTFKEAAQRYWDLVGCKSDKSWECRYNQLVKEFGHLRLVEVKPDIIQRWYNRKVAESKVGAGSANRTLTQLRAIFNRAIDWDLYNGVNPIRKVLKQADPEALTRFLSLDEMLALFSACDERILPIVYFALLTGLRKSEALWFDWKDVTQDLRFIKAHRRKKGGFPDIPVSDKLRRLLLYLGPRKAGRLFDITPAQFRESFEAARVKAGLEHFTWRDFRRTFASHFTMATKDRPSLKKLLGHRTNFMVDRYAYLDDDHLLTQMNTFDAAMPDLPSTLRCLDSLGVGHHPGHQAVAACSDRGPAHREIAIISQSEGMTDGQLAQR